jgi:type VI secretion system protein ImpC
LCETGASLANRRTLVIDRDNFDDVLAKSGAEIHLRLGKDDSLCLRFSGLDDFHPDRLFEHVNLFRKLREVRDRLQDPATFAAAAEEFGLSPGPPPRPHPPAAEPATSAAPSISRLASGSLLDELIEQSEVRGSESRPSRAPDELHEFVRRVTQPHLVAAADPRQAEVISLIDRAVSTQMRTLLHTPDFQALEAAWRAVFLLVRRIETGSQLKLHLIDISKAELAADLGSSPDLRSTAVYRLLVAKTVETRGAEPWALIAGNYTFGPDFPDVELLARLARIANATPAPFLAATSPRLLGCVSFAVTPHPRDWKLAPAAESAAAWAALRRLPEACSVGLILPRFLLRLPYGKKTDPAESFDFEEMPDAPSHEDYLWGNPAFAGALLLAQAFGEEGWEMRPGVTSEIDGLPLHVYEQNGESELKPCAEALLTEDAAESILENGLMPLVSLKGQDAVRLVRFQSIAEPRRALAGRWNESLLPT